MGSLPLAAGGACPEAVPAEKPPARSEARSAPPVVLMEELPETSQADEMRTVLGGITAEKESYGMKMQPPCAEADITRLQREVKKKLHAELPPEFTSFLRLTDGLDYDGLVIFGHKTQPIAGCEKRALDGVVEANRRLRDNEELKAFLVLGESEDSLYAFDPKAARFVTLDNGSLERGTAFKTFGELFLDAMQSFA